MVVVVAGFSIWNTFMRFICSKCHNETMHKCFKRRKRKKAKQKTKWTSSTTNKHGNGNAIISKCHFIWELLMKVILLPLIWSNSLLCRRHAHIYIYAYIENDSLMHTKCWCVICWYLLLLKIKSRMTYACFNNYASIYFGHFNGYKGKFCCVCHRRNFVDYVFINMSVLAEWFPFFSVLLQST